MQPAADRHVGVPGDQRRHQRQQRGQVGGQVDVQVRHDGGVRGGPGRPQRPAAALGVQVQDVHAVQLGREPSGHRQGAVGAGVVGDGDPEAVRQPPAQVGVQPAHGTARGRAPRRGPGRPPPARSWRRRSGRCPVPRPAWSSVTLRDPDRRGGRELGADREEREVLAGAPAGAPVSAAVSGRAGPEAQGAPDRAGRPEPGGQGQEGGRGGHANYVRWPASDVPPRGLCTVCAQPAHSHRKATGTRRATSRVGSAPLTCGNDVTSPYRADAATGRLRCPGAGRRRRAGARRPAVDGPALRGVGRAHRCRTARRPLRDGAPRCVPTPSCST